jgi:hypothetical protein
VTAEEARYVFSEVIQKFLSQPIRQTSYIVDQIIAKIDDRNFFPTTILNDMKAVVDQETENLDKKAMPFLIAKLVQALTSFPTAARSNAEGFFLVFASKRDPEIRTSLVKMLINPKSSDNENAGFFSQLATCDPEILRSIGAGTRLRYQSLLLKNAGAFEVAHPYRALGNPAHVLGACVQTIGEDFMLNEMAEFTDWVVSNSPYAPEFISQIGSVPKIFERVFCHYLASLDFHGKELA